MKVGNKKKGQKPVFKILIKRKKHTLAKKAKAPFKRNLNTFTTVLPLKKGVTQAAKVLNDLKHSIIVIGYRKNENVQT